tara:strand:+ start:91864 stop:92394 length:531 start_codon:yes stop_codon:yes gene_type:complete
MKPTIPVLSIIAATSGLALAGFESSLRIDVSGYEFRDELGDPDNMVLAFFLNPQLTITGVSWHLNLTTLTDPGASFPSWASETNIDFNGQANIQVSTTPGGVENELNTGSAEFNYQLGSDGYVLLEFWDSFDDSPGMADAVLGDGSWLDLHFPFPPAPGPLAAMGVGGLFAARRRR